jgi:murein DD-endopeptidase MepM/ murein hydrolase activator NlpD
LAALLVAVAGSAWARTCDLPAPSTVAVGPSRQPSDAGDARVKRFWVRDHHYYRSAWYAGKHRKMVGFGCTAAPYYDPDPRCRHHHGYHHGLDIAMPCGTRLYAGLRGRVVRPHSAGALGPAYGPDAFRLRNSRLGRDFVIGHVLQVYVRPGDRVARGTLMARASDQGAPDGCHLHFEVRPAGGGYTDAVPPASYLHLRRVE